MAWLAFASLTASLPGADEKSVHGAETHYHATRWTPEDGLPQMRISALAQTPDGYLWAGTWFGLARFDGVRFVVFNGVNTPEFKKESITALAADRADGTLWIGTPEGVVLLKERHFTRLSDNHELTNAVVVALVSSSTGGVWVWTQGTVELWRGRTSIRVPFKVATGEVRQTAWETEDGHLILNTNLRCLEVTPAGSLREWQLPAGAPLDQWLAGTVGTDHGRQIWLGSQRGLFRFADGRWQALRSFFPRRSPCDHFLPDRDGGVWAACERIGLFRYAANDAERVSLRDRIAEETINCLLQDHEGGVWVGSDRGLFQLRPRLVHTFSVADGLPEDECRSVCEAPDGSIWVEGAGRLARIKGDTVETLAGEPTRKPWVSVVVSRDETVWLGDGHNGLLAWQPGSTTNRFWNSPDFEGGNRVTLEALYLDHAGRVWAGTDHGATWFENGQPATHWGELGLPTNSVRSIYETRDGTFWFGTWQAGAVRWRSRQAAAATGHSSQRYTVAEGLADDRVFVFHEDTDGALWIGTHNGLSRFRDGRWFTFRTEQGLLDNLINWLEEDDVGRLWFSCNRGIFRMERAELNDVAAGRKSRATAIVYGAADGMLTPETNGEHQPAGCKGRDGRLWFPTAQGVVVIDPRRLHETELPPPVVIEQVRANDEIVFGDDQAGTKLPSANRESPLLLPPGHAPRGVDRRFAQGSSGSDGHQT